MEFFLKKLPLIFFSLGICMISTANAQSPLPKEMQDIEFNYFVVLGGKCNKLVINKEDFTEICMNYFWHMSIKDRLIMVAMLGFENDNQSQLTFSGSQFQQPRLNRATLFLDYSRFYDGTNVIAESNVVGTCETYGDPVKEVTKHVCVAQTLEGDEMIFEFSSYPDQIEIFN